MPTTFPALRGHFGVTEYYLSTMSIGELVKTVRLPREIPGWEDESIEDRYQRELNLRRVRREIAPYFASDEQRFSGALVLAVMNHGNMAFEPLPNIGGGRNPVPQLYQSAARDMGFLTFDGAEVLVPLDGQHRTKAFKFAIEGTDDNNRPIEGVKSNLELANDQVAVILVKFEAVESRRIFNKINRYAKPTTKADNLITDDDDAMAVITRELLGEGGVIPAKLVRIDANNLNKSSNEFTTLATFYDCNLVIVHGLQIVASGTPQGMPEQQRELVQEQIERVWERLLAKIDLWRKALDDTTPAGDKTRIAIRDETILGKPIGQLSLVRGFMLMRERCDGVSEDDLCDRLNLIDWGVGNTMWHGVLINPNGRMMSGRQNVNRACEFIAHLGGAELTSEEDQRLREHIHGEEWERHSLPDRVV